jgi:hypothetical protein
MARRRRLTNAPAAPTMADHTMPIELPAPDAAAYRNAVIDCARPGEREQCERLLGQLASVEAPAASSGTLRFIPWRDTADLARRALAQLEHARRRPDGRRARPRRRIG